MLDVILKRFDSPDEVRNFEKGKFELVRIGNMTIGRATYAPGWKWSTHVGQALGKKSCDVEHIGMWFPDGRPLPWTTAELLK